MQGLSKIGIDLGSLLFYILNFGVIVLVLAKFVYKPALKFLDERREAIKNNLAESEYLRAEFTKQIEEQKSTHENYTNKLKLEMDKMRAEAEAKNKQFLVEAEAERDRMIAEAKKQSEALKSELENRVEKELLERVNTIVNEAVKKKLSGEDARSYILKAWKEMRAKN